MIARKTRNLVLFCSCSESQKFPDVDFEALAERVRTELADRVECVAVHPQLCSVDGERLMIRLLDPATRVITMGCCCFQQRKMLRDGFERAGVSITDAHWVPISIEHHDTQSAFAEIEEALLDPEEVVATGGHLSAD
jgi:hypothetical protein